MTFFTDVGYVDSNASRNSLAFVGRNFFDEKLLFDIEKYISSHELEKAKARKTSRCWLWPRMVNVSPK